MPTIKHCVIYIPGLADRTLRHMGQASLLHSWRWRFGVRTSYFTVGWADAAETFDHKVQSLLERIDTWHSKNYHVSIVAVSAGATLALKALAERPSELHRVVLVAGKAHDSGAVAKAIYVANPMLKPAVRQLSTVLRQIPNHKRQDILIAKPLSDRVIALEDMNIDGAQYLRLPVSGHLIAIVGSLTFFARAIVTFLKK